MALRVGIGAVLLAVLIAAFSLRPTPRPLTGGLGGQTFDASAAARQLDELAQRYPSRRAGSSGDALLATRMAAELRRALPTASIDRDRFRADTPDGSRELENVSATVRGRPGPGLVVVAHRDALEPGSKAELSGTAALLALARAVGESRFDHTIQFVSTSGASGGGLTGATRLARTLRGQAAAVLVLGDVSGPVSRTPQVVTWSNRGPSAPLRLQRSVVAAMRQEGLAVSPQAGPWSQIVRRALPATVGEQGELNQARIPAVLITSGSAVPPAADAPVEAPRMGAYGRATLRTLHALDRTRVGVGAPQSELAIVGRLLPQWSLQVLLLALVLPLLFPAIVVALTLARDGHPLVPGAAWAAGCATGPLVAGLLAIGLGRIGIVSPAVPAPFAGPALELGVGSWALVVLLAAILVATVALSRPRLAREAPGPDEPTPVGVATAVFAALVAVVLTLVVLEPLAAILLLPALLAWPAALMLPMLRPLHRWLLLGTGALLPLSALLSVSGSLDVGVVDLPWWLVLLVAGGQITPVAMLLTSIVLGALLATTLMLLPRGRRPRRRATSPSRGPRRRRDDPPLLVEDR